MNPDDTHPYIIALISLLIFLALNFIAGLLGYFQAEAYRRKPLSLMDVFVVFGIFISVEFVVFPLIAYSWLSISEGHLIPAHSFDLLYRDAKWLPLLGIILGCAAPLIYNGITQKVDWGSLRNIFKDTRIAIASWILAFPAAVVVSKTLETISAWAGWVQQPDQVAVQLVKGSLGDPQLFIRLVLTIIILVPLAEELLFRGYLQGYLIQKMTRLKAIAITSVFFVLFHFAPSQGFTNLTVLLSLFPLSCYLGYLREKQKSLWAPVTLHAIFNMISIIMLAVQGAEV